MSEENTTETNEAPPEETSTSTIDLDATVKVDGEEISVRELINTRDEAVKLREYNENAKKLISPSGVDDESREQAVRFLMSQEGYTVEDINEYINWTKQIAEEPTEQPQMETPSYDDEELENPDEAPKSSFDEPRYQEEMMMREQEQQRITNVENRQQKLGAEMMRKEMMSALNNTIGNNDKIQKLMNLSPESSEDSKREDVIKIEVETQMMDNLRRRRASGENYNPSWFAEEASKAADLVYDKFRSVIGDPDRIQRSPETATDSDSLFNKPPVEPPKFETGDTMGDINVKAREWTLDTLLRGARDGAAGGESKA
jgi:hypothetical protein